MFFRYASLGKRQAEIAEEQKHRRKTGYKQNSFVAYLF